MTASKLLVSRRKKPTCAEILSTLWRCFADTIRFL